MPDRASPITLRVTEWEIGEPRRDYLPVRIRADRGQVECRWYPTETGRAGAVFIGGVGGGWDTPACDLYPRLCSDLPADGIAGIRIRYRDAHSVEEGLLDVLAALLFLEAQGIEQAAVVGHSLGGAVAIQAGAHSALVRTVVALATQSYGAGAATGLAPRCSLLLVHGTADRVLPDVCSRQVFVIAGEPKALEIIEGAGHNLDEAADRVEKLVRGWLCDELRRARAGDRAQPAD